MGWLRWRSSNGRLDLWLLSLGLRVLSQERFFERGLAADEVGQLELGSGPDDFRDVARDTHAQDVFLGRDIAHAGERAESLYWYRAREHELHLMVGEVTQ